MLLHQLPSLSFPFTWRLVPGRQCLGATDAPVAQDNAPTGAGVSLDIGIGVLLKQSSVFLWRILCADDDA
jgi:hypothetical protein